MTAGDPGLYQPQGERLAVVIVAHGTRRLPLLPAIVASCLLPYQAADEVVVVGDLPDAAMPPLSVPYVCVPPVTNTTLDALTKRDVGWLVTTSDAVLFLSDDHRLTPGFMTMYRASYGTADDWDFLRPWRVTHRGEKQYVLNNGSDKYGEYCAGHGGVYRRACARRKPWSTVPHRNWDLLHSLALTAAGLRLRVAGAELAIEDVEPNSEPWR